MDCFWLPFLLINEARRYSLPSRSLLLCFPVALSCHPVQRAVKRSGRNSEKENMQKVGTAAACDVSAAWNSAGQVRLSHGVPAGLGGKPEHLAAAPLSFHFSFQLFFPPSPISTFEKELSAAAKSVFRAHLHLFSVAALITHNKGI